MNKAKGKIMTDEDDEMVEVTSMSYKNFLFRYLGGMKIICNTFVWMGLYMVA